MARQLTQAITNQINKKDIRYQCILKINGVDKSDYLISYSNSFSKDFGAASAVLQLDNSDSRFALGGVDLINVGDIVEVIEKYRGDSIEWKNFYGFVDQRSFQNTSSSAIITLNCLDFIARLQHLDVDLELEGEKFKISNETLTPNYLTAPNDDLAQVFNFANDAVATSPAPILTITAQDSTTDDPQFDGFEILYAQGQVKLGSPLNARYNYNLKARSYYSYSRGLYAEDILEEILTQQTGYNQYLFGEASAQDVIDNHLIETFSNMQGSVGDTLTPNTAEEEITIYSKLTTAVVANDVSIALTSTEGFPSAGTGEINGDSFTWTSKDSTHLYGIPSSGDYALKAHPVDAYVKYTATYSVGQVWYLTYSNLQTALVEANFSGFTPASVSYVDLRFGRILLSEIISITATVLCNVDYTFKTLQATGIEINQLSFRSREVENRFDAISKLRNYLSPNWVIYTVGSEKIWASYLYQKLNADYELKLVSAITQLEDDDLYTRVKFFGKNKNPKNVLFENGVQFLDTGEDFTGIATQLSLTLDREEGNFYVYKSSISGVGKIILDTIIPTVYINGQPIDNNIHAIPQAPIQVVVRTRTETETHSNGSGAPDVEVRTYYDYDVYFAHGNILPSETVHIYNSLGVEIYTIPPNTSGFAYEGGKWTIGGGVRNTTIEQFSYASYSVLYNTSDLVIDYDNVLFKIDKSLLPTQTNALVTATFEYLAIFQSILDIHNVIDGRFNTQTQTIFYAEPPTGFNYAILDFGQVREIQALDITPGYYKPDNLRKFDVDMRLTFQASDDNVEYREISDKTHNFDISTGTSVSFEESDLGIGFSARYIKVIIENLKKILVGSTTNTNGSVNEGVWVAAFTEVAAYEDIILTGEATLIPATNLATAINIESSDSSGEYPIVVTVDSTSGFDASGSAYIEEDLFYYTGKTATTFTGVTGLNESHDAGARVSQELAGDSTIYDYKGLIEKLGDRLYKKVNVDDQILYDQTTLNRLSRAYLKEFIKNHDRLEVQVLFAPYLRVGQTVEVTYDKLSIAQENYFIETLTGNNGYLSLVLAKYPED